VEIFRDTRKQHEEGISKTFFLSVAGTVIDTGSGCFELELLPITNRRITFEHNHFVLVVRLACLKCQALCRIRIREISGNLLLNKRLQSLPPRLVLSRNHSPQTGIPLRLISYLARGQCNELAHIIFQANHGVKQVVSQRSTLDCPIFPGTDTEQILEFGEESFGVKVLLDVEAAVQEEGNNLLLIFILQQIRHSLNELIRLNIHSLNMIEKNTPHVDAVQGIQCHDIRQEKVYLIFGEFDAAVAFVIGVDEDTGRGLE